MAVAVRSAVTVAVGLFRELEALRQSLPVLGQSDLELELVGFRDVRDRFEMVPPPLEREGLPLAVEPDRLDRHRHARRIDGPLAIQEMHAESRGLASLEDAQLEGAAPDRDELSAMPGSLLGRCPPSRCSFSE